MALNRILPVAAVLMAGACAATAPVTVARLSADPVVSGGTYTSGGGLTVAAEVREAKGRTLVCGVWAKSVQQSILTKHAERKVLDRGSVLLAGRRIVSGLTFMREVLPAPSYAGRKANCIATDRAWRSGDSLRDVTIQLPRQIVYHGGGSDGLDIPDPTVYFEQSGPGAGG